MTSTPAAPAPPFWSPRTVRAGWLRAAFIAAIVGAFALRIVLRIATTDFHDPELWEFERIAQNLLDHGTFAFRDPEVPSAFMPPAYPITIYLLYAAFGVGATAHWVLSGILWACEFATPFLIGAIASRVWSARAGFVAFLVALFWPTMLLTSGRLHDVSVYTFVLLVAVALLFDPAASSWRRAIGVGVVMGVFWTFRFEAPVYLLPIAAYAVFGAPDLLASGLVRRATVGAVLVLCFLVPLSPWLVRNHGLYGTPIFSTEGGYALWRGHHDRATGTGRDLWPANRGTGVINPPPEVLTDDGTPKGELVRDAWYRQEALDWIAANPGREVTLVGLKLYYFLVADFTHPVARLAPFWLPSLVALVVGVVFWLRTGLRDPKQWVLVTIFAAQCGLIVMLFVLARFRIMVEFVPLVFASAWLAEGPMRGWLERRVLAD